MVYMLRLMMGWILFGGIGNLLSQDYVTTVARPGDGPISLLRHYQCYTPCNLDHFYTINRIRTGKGLLIDKTYKLPILIYSYNGKSIRSTIGIDDFPRAKRIQIYNETLHNAQLKTSDYREGKVLWVPYHFISCPDQRAETPVETVAQRPGNSGSSKSSKPIGMRGSYPIFGKKYAKVPLINNNLKGKVFYVVAGHGGPDPGAMGKRWGKTLAEDEYAYDISLRLTRNLLMYGATVYVIVRDPNDGIRNGEYLRPDQDEVVWGDVPIPRNQVLRLQQRADIVNALYEKNRQSGVVHQRQVIIHIDSRYKNKRIDMFFYHKEADSEGRFFANTLFQTIDRKYAEISKTRGYNGSVSERDLFMLRETRPTSVFIELGNIRNSLDQARWVIESNRELVAQWLTEGILLDALK